MDRTVPAAAAELLQFIYKTETGKSPPACYEVIYGHRQDRLPKPLTTMTVDEVLAAQMKLPINQRAVGAPQFIPATLQGLKAQLGLFGSQKFDGDLQDRLAYHLLKRRKFPEWQRGDISDIEFAKRLAQEWASFPVLADTRGAHRDIKRGQSYYAGDGINKALITPAQVEALLARARAPGVPVKPRPKPTDVVAGAGAVVTAGGAAMAAQQGNWAVAVVMALIVAAVVAIIIFRNWRK